MKAKPVILVVDDQIQNRDLLEACLVPEGYEIIKAVNGKEALQKLAGNQIDLILLDVMMPDIDGFEVTGRVRQDKKNRLVPIILVTALHETEDRVKGIEAGCDDFLSKPVDKTELLAKVQSLLKIKVSNDLMSNYRKELESEVINITGELKQSNTTLDEQNAKNMFLENEVQARTKEVTAMHRLTQYFSPKVAERLMADDNLFRTKRKNITIFFVDIRGFTKISEEVEPEELLGMLNEYFDQMTQVVFSLGGTVGKFIGDAIMGFFGDPEECENHAELAVRMALEMQAKVKVINEKSLLWSDHHLDVGIGINTGYVTVGNVGSEHHKDYTVIGRHVNLASRLTELAKPGQILISHRTYNLIAKMFKTEAMGNISVKGFDAPVLAYNVLDRMDGNPVSSHNEH